MLDTNTHCQMVTAHIRDCNARIMDGFKLFVQIFSAIAGGTVWAKLQYGSKVTSRLVVLSDALAFIVLVVCCVIVLDNLRSWHGYRDSLAVIAGTDEGGNKIPPPDMIRAAKVELTMFAVMILATLSFMAFNPLMAS